jgi:putative phosphoribosyl transferase
MIMNTHISDQIHEVTIGQNRVAGLLGIPAAARGLIIFAHGSGSGRKSPRNTYVAAKLREAGLATLLLDLLTPGEESNRANVFDIDLLAQRLAEASDWASDNGQVADLPLGYFGASTGGGAALVAAANDPRRVAAVVSRGGRPDLAGSALRRVSAPTLLIVGGADETVLALNRSAYERLRCEKDLAIVPRAGHLFEEPGALDAVIDHTSRWFLGYLTPDSVQRRESNVRRSS